MALNGEPSKQALLEPETEHGLEKIATKAPLNPFGVSTLPKPLKLFDEYKIVGGVPAFVFKPPNGLGGLVKNSFPHFAFSRDGCFMTLVSRTSFVRLYNVSNHSVREEGHDCFDNDAVVYTGFRARAFIAVDDHGSVLIVPAKDQGTSQNALREKILEFEHATRIQPKNERSGIKEIVYVDFDEAEIWLIMKNFMDEVLFSQIGSDGERQDLTISTSEDNDSAENQWLVSVRARSVMKTESAPCDSNTKTQIWNGFGSSSRLMPEPVEMPGKGLCWTPDGKYVLFWTVSGTGEHKAELYLNDSITRRLGSNPVKHASFLAGYDLLSLKAKWIDRNLLHQLTTQKEENSGSENNPVVALLVVHPAGVECLAWDTKTNKVVYEIELSLPERKEYNASEIEFCFSSDLKWIGVVSAEDHSVSLFSTLSGVSVWKYSFLPLSSVKSSLFVPIQFDPKSSRMIVNCGRDLYVFIPPCFATHGSTSVLHKRYSHTFEASLSDDPIKELKRFSKAALFNVLTLILGSLEDSKCVGMFDIATCLSSSKVAVLWKSKEHLVVLLLPIKDLFSASFKKWLEDAYKNPRYTPGHQYQNVSIKSNIRKELKESLLVFLYRESPQSDEAISLFSMRSNGVFGIFADFKNEPQKIECFCTQRAYDAKQSNDGFQVLFLCATCIQVVDLCKQALVNTIDYKMDLSPWWKSFIVKIKGFWYFKFSNIEPDIDSLVEDDAFTLFHQQKSRGLFDISDDGEQILIGWNHANSQPLIISRGTTAEEFRETWEQCENDITRCYALNNDFSQFAYAETDAKNIKQFNMVLHRAKGGTLISLDSSSWKTTWTKILTERRDEPHNMFLRMDNAGTYLWILVLQNTAKYKSRMEWFLIGSYSLDDSLPSLDMLNVSNDNVDENYIHNAIEEFGSSVFNMEFDGMTNLQSAWHLTNDDRKKTFFKIALTQKLQLSLVWSQGHGSSANLLSEAIQDKDKTGVEAALDAVKKQLTPFAIGANMMKGNFTELWMDYRELTTPMLLENELAFTFCQDAFCSSSSASTTSVQDRLGTCDNFSTLKNTSHKSILELRCKSLSDKPKTSVNNQEQKIPMKASLKVLCMENICKIGPDGIIRLLTMQNTPSSIFKTDLVKSVVNWKWEYIWKNRSWRQILFYVIFLVIFTSFAIIIGYHGDDVTDEVWKPILIALLLVTLILMTLVMLRTEYIQVKTYIRDGKHLFGQRWWWGICHYLSSAWNVLELLSYFLMLVVIPVLQVATIIDSNLLQWLYFVVAFESILLWIKIWYFAQSFKRTGPLVLLIENIVRDCIPFLILTGVVLLGFSVGLFVLFQKPLKDFDESTADEGMKKVHDSFGTPWNAMETLFYAMVGTFEPEVYRCCKSISALATLIFSFYIGAQLIVMLNMLISIMSDTFDKVKSREEEQLLMGRARFIDACEASLTKKQIEEMESKIGKYLYVFEPEDDVHSDMGHWEGKIKLIADTVDKRITKSQKDIATQITASETSMSVKIAKLEEKIDKLHEMLSKHLSSSDENRAATNPISRDVTERTNSRSNSEEENYAGPSGNSEDEYQSSLSD